MIILQHTALFKKKNYSNIQSVIHKSAEIRTSSMETSHVVMMGRVFLLNPQVKVNK